MSCDLKALDFASWGTYVYTLDNPSMFSDPDGREPEDYPVIRITKQKTGETAEQRVIGFTNGNNNLTTNVDLYKVEVSDTEDPSFSMVFSVTRDGWTVTKDALNASNGSIFESSNTAFEPQDGDINHYTGIVMGNGYPEGNGTQALKLMQSGSEVMHAEPNQTSVDMGYRKSGIGVASGVMLHVGGNYSLGGKNRVAASEGCFGIVNINNSSINRSNSISNGFLTRIINQAARSKMKPGHIEIIIEKREGNEYPQSKTVGN